MKKNNLISFICITFISFSSFAKQPVKKHSYSFFEDLYVGVDYGLANTEFESGFGDNLFHDTHYQVTPFLGYYFGKHFGVELGFAKGFSSDRDTTLNAGDVNLGAAVGATGSYHNKSDIDSFYMSLLFRMSPSDFGSNNKYLENLSLVAGVGYATQRVNLTRNLLNDDGEIIDTIDLKYDSSKSVARISGGLDYKIFNSFRVRGNVVWKNTSKLEPYNYNSADAFRTAKLKNTVEYNVGIVFDF